MAIGQRRKPIVPKINTTFAGVSDTITPAAPSASLQLAALPTPSLPPNAIPDPLPSKEPLLSHAVPAVTHRLTQGAEHLPQTRSLFSPRKLHRSLSLTIEPPHLQAPCAPSPIVDLHRFLDLPPTPRDEVPPPTAVTPLVTNASSTVPPVSAAAARPWIEQHHLVAPPSSPTFLTQTVPSPGLSYTTLSQQIHLHHQNQQQNQQQQQQQQQPLRSHVALTRTQALASAGAKTDGYERMMTLASVATPLLEKTDYQWPSPVGARPATILECSEEIAPLAPPANDLPSTTTTTVNTTVALRNAHAADVTLSAIGGPAAMVLERAASLGPPAVRPMFQPTAYPSSDTTMIPCEKAVGEEGSAPHLHALPTPPMSLQPSTMPSPRSSPMDPVTPLFAMPTDPFHPHLKKKRKRVEKLGHFPCTVSGCSQVFRRAHNLKSHLKTHSDEKPFACELCDKAFRRIHDKERHMLVHGGDREHVCVNCLTAFNRPDALKRHLRIASTQGCRTRDRKRIPMRPNEQIEQYRQMYDC